jgi:hypothetical protein
MKAICIDNENVSQWVTVGKWYDIIEDATSFYVLVKNESGWKLIDRKHFRTESELREEKLKKLGI